MHLRLVKDSARSLPKAQGLALMRERPESQLLLRRHPEPGETMGLDDQEKDNQRPEDYQFRVRSRGGGNGNPDQRPERRQELAEEDRQDDNEGSTEEACLLYTSDAADE